MKSGGRRAALAVAGAALLGRTLRVRVARFQIAEASMTPTLQEGDYVLAFRTGRPPRRGAVTVFEHPRRAGFFLTKRVIGLPGESVAVRAGLVHVNGAPLDEPWTIEETGPPGSWQLSADEAFVLGDHRAISSGDSRELGPVPLHSVQLRVVFRYWPPGRIGGIAR